MSCKIGKNETATVTGSIWIYHCPGLGRYIINGNPKEYQQKYGGFRNHGGTPSHISHHPLIDGVFP